MRKTALFMILLALPLISAGCNKGPAEGAVKDAEAAVASIQADAEKYYPDQFEGLQSSLEKLRAKFEEGRYSGVQLDSKMIRSRVEKLSELVASRKEEVAEQWNGLLASLPDSLAKVEAKAEELAKLRRLPEGVDREGVDAARSALEEIRQTWEAARADYDGGKPLDALQKASEVKTKLAEAAQRLGLDLEA